MKFKYLAFSMLLLSVLACHDDQTPVQLQKDNTTVSDLFSGAERVGAIAFEDLDEASGLANSAYDQALFWSHNDSGGEPALYLFDLEGERGSKIFLSGAENIDWEDMAIGVGPVDDVNYLYVGDIGDNQAIREHLTIYRAPEPDLKQMYQSSSIEESSIERIHFVYEDGARDAETLMLDPLTKHIYLVTKREPKVLLYKLPYPQNTQAMDTAIRVAELPYTYMTAGDISNDGKEILIKNYLNIYYWQRKDNEPLEQLLVNEGIRLAYEPEPQGEAIAWAHDRSAFYTISEKARTDKVFLIRYTRN